MSLLGWGDPCYQYFGCWLLVLLQVISASMRLASFSLSEWPTQHTKSHDFCTLPDEGSRTSLRWWWRSEVSVRLVYYTDVSKCRAAFIFRAKQYRNCSWITPLWKTKILRSSKFSEICCWGFQFSCVWCYVAGSWPTFRVNEMLSSIRAGLFKTFLRNGGRRGTQRFSVTSRMTCSSLKSSNERLL